ncbi:MAG: hypothetical protein JW840_10700 [Candidatus Thermoplasmatota archaeon]|nr:hypothetical protein [Candidatus Thermoplasmatota archaeon]
MVNIWKIGTAPGLGEESTIDKIYYLSYATGERPEVKDRFAAIGYGFIDHDLKNLYSAGMEEAERIIREALIMAEKGKIGRRMIEIHDFACNIKENDVVVHYFTKGQAYVGEVEKSYYYVEHNEPRDYFNNYSRETNPEVNRAPHRINVKWKIDKQGMTILYDGINFNWYDTVHRIRKEDLKRVDNKEIREYLERKINDGL